MVMQNNQGETPDTMRTHSNRLAPALALLAFALAVPVAGDMVRAAIRRVRFI
jgi:hypothetical protein